MAAQLVWYAADGITPLAKLEFGTIMPGNSYFGLNAGYLQAILKNDGDLATTVEVAIVGVGTSVADDYLRLATGDPTPGTFFVQASPINIGSLAPAAQAKFWVDVIVPPGAPLVALTNANLVATGT